MSEDAEEYARAIALMAYAVAPNLKPKAYLVHEICDLSERGGISTRHVPDTRISCAVLTKIFESAKFRNFLMKTCPGVALTVSFRRKSNKIKVEHEITFDKVGIMERSNDKRPLQDKISDVKASLMKNVCSGAVKSSKRIIHASLFIFSTSTRV